MRPAALLCVLAGLALAAAPPVLGPGHSLKPAATWTDDLGQRHTRYRHYYLGRRVWSSEWIEHAGPGAEAPEPAQALTGVTLAGPLPARNEAAFQAFAAAAQEPILLPTYVEVPALAEGELPTAAAMDHHLQALVPATLVTTPADAGEPEAPAFSFIRDDATGEVLQELPLQRYEVPARGLGRSLYQGDRPLDTTLREDGSYVLRDATRGGAGISITDAGNADGAPASYVHAASRPHPNTWGDGRNEAPGAATTSPNGETMAVDMALGLGQAWDYFRTVHHRLGPDNLGTGLTGIAHVVQAEIPGDNASWTFAIRLDDVRVVSSRQAQVVVRATPSVLDFWENGTDQVTLAGTLEGSDDQRIRWSVLPPYGGRLLGARYTQPAQTGSYWLQGQSVADPASTDLVSVRVRPTIALTAPVDTVEVGGHLVVTVTLAPGATLAPGVFVVGDDQGVCVPLTDTSLSYTPGGVPGTYQILAVASPSGKVATFTVTVLPPVTVAVTPAQVVLAEGAGLQFGCEVQGDPYAAVDWSVLETKGGGAVSPTGLYAAPQVPGTYHVLARSRLEPTVAAVATVVVPDGLAVDPPSATLVTGAATAFASGVPGLGDGTVLWTLPQGGGTFQGGVYTAPSAPGTYTLTATSKADPTLATQVTVTVKTTDLNGNGQTLLDFGDLAWFADAYGSADPAEDFNGDGRVDAKDEAIFLNAFGGQP